ncbi:MAG: protease pro-enzyme activation domain-containing protein, partial [Terriglobales bacterium]
MKRTVMIVLVLLSIAVSALPGFAETQSNAGCTPLAIARISGGVDDDVRIALPGNVHPLARAEFDLGRVDDALLMEHIIMVLRRTPTQELALQTRIDQMHNRRSPLFQQWLSAKQVGSCYGVADQDIAMVSSWLQAYGFRIDSVPSGKMLIMFTGTAGQVRQAFHTEIHNLNVRGEKHIANMSAPQIPAALAPVVAGFRSLHNFFPKPMVHVLGPVKRDARNGRFYPAAPKTAWNSFQSKRNGPNP